MVTIVNGVANGLLTAVGSLVGGWVCDRMNRRLAYALAGAATAVVGIAMSMAPLSPATYAVGALVYMLVTGFCYAAFSAMVLEIIGAQKGAAASAQYTLFTAAGNGAIAYVTAVDGWGYAHHGPRGLLVTDALANIVGIAMLLGLSYALLRPRAASPAPVVRTP
jgi:MFS family permease